VRRAKDTEYNDVGTPSTPSSASHIMRLQPSHRAVSRRAKRFPSVDT
jgi:hypothetical protein